MQTKTDMTLLEDLENLKNLALSQTTDGLERRFILGLCMDIEKALEALEITKKKAIQFVRICDCNYKGMGYQVYDRLDYAHERLTEEEYKILREVYYGDKDEDEEEE